MSTVPADSEGDTAVIEELELIWYEAAGLEPKKTFVTPLNPLPTRLIDEPPFCEPELGETAVTAAARSCRISRISAPMLKGEKSGRRRRMRIARHGLRDRA